MCQSPVKQPEIREPQSLREAIERLRLMVPLPSYVEHMLDEALKAEPEYELAGYEGSAGFYYSKMLAAANGEQLIEPIYRVKK